MKTLSRQLNMKGALKRLHQSARLRAIATILLMHGLTLCVHAQTNRGSVGNAAYRAFTEAYNEWRGPISLCAIVVCAICMMTMGRRCYGVVGTIILGVVVFALAPELYQSFSAWGGR